jgi:FkbM family methyltransferase
MAKPLDLKNFESLLLVRTKDNKLMFVNKFDQYISQNIAVNGEWEPHIRAVLHNFLKPGMVAIDVGANIGAHTLLMSQLVTETGKVLAFEPNEYNYTVLLLNSITSKSLNISLYKQGCGEHTETRYMDAKWQSVDHVDNYGCITLNKENTSADTAIDIISIDSLNLERLDLIKIDAEYMEEQVLKGMKDTIQRLRPIIILEIHANEIPTIQALLEQHNYVLTYIGGIDYIAMFKE